MPTNKIIKIDDTLGIGYGPGFAGIKVDTTDLTLQFNPDGTIRTCVDLSSTQTITGDKTFTGTVVMSGAVTKTEFADGTAAAPSITFSNGLTDGIYRIGTNNIGIALNGAIEWNLSTTAFSPGANAGSALGTTSLGWNGLHLGTGTAINWVNGDVTLTHAANSLTIAGGVTTFSDSITMASQSPSSHFISFEGATLANNMNAIRGASVNPTRTSGWISFSGTISTTPNPCYTDFRQLTTTGVAEVLGIGSFPTMASGASCKSAFGIQSICQVDAGATVTSAAAAQGTGIYPLYGKVLIDGATVNPGAQIAAAWLSVQANVTSISGEASALVHGEVASGTLRDLFYFNATAGNLATNLFNFSASTAPIVAGGAGTSTAASGNWLQVRVVVNGTAYYFPICSSLWTNV